MSTQGVILGICGLALAACGHHSAPETAAAADRDSTPCVQQDTGIDLGHDVSRGPRYRVDGAGRVETLPPVPVAGADTATARSDSVTRGCRTIPETASDTAGTGGGATPR